VREKQERQAAYERQQQKLVLERAEHADALKRRQAAYEHEVALREQRRRLKARVAEAKAERADESLQANVTLLLRGEPRGKSPFKVTVPRSQRLGVLAERGAAHFGLTDIHKVRLVRQGGPLKRADTAAALGLRNGDALGISQAE